MLLSDAAPALEKKASEIRRSIDKLAAVRADLDRERANFEKTNQEVNSRRTVLAELVETKQAERDVAASLAAAAQKETAALAARATSLRGILRALSALPGRLHRVSSHPHRIARNQQGSPRLRENHLKT